MDEKQKYYQGLFREIEGALSDFRETAREWDDLSYFDQDHGLDAYLEADRWLTILRDATRRGELTAADNKRLEDLIRQHDALHATYRNLEQHMKAAPSRDEYEAIVEEYRRSHATVHPPRSA